MFQPGDVVIAAFPFTTLAAVKRRPCVILAPGDVPHDFVVAFITSSSTAATLPSAVVISPTQPGWNATGLKAPSVIRVDKLVTLNDTVISGAIGVLPEDVLRNVRARLKTLFRTP